MNCRVVVKEQEDILFYDGEDYFGFFVLSEVRKHQSDKGYGSLEEAADSYRYMLPGLTRLRPSRD